MQRSKVQDTNAGARLRTARRAGAFLRLRRQTELAGTGIGRIGSHTVMIELKGISKRFSGKREVIALDGVDLKIARGELVSIVGPSGSGKSTMLNLIGGLDTPSTGEVWIDGSRLNEASDDDLTRMRRDKIGFIFQFFNLLPTLSALENVSLPLHLRGWPRQKTKQRALELLDMVGLQKRSDHLPDELSGGERQRVAISRALSINPPIILGDEPTGNLDTHTGADVLSLLKDLNLKLGTTIVIVTHDLGVAASCQRSVRMRDGRIVEDVRNQNISRPDVEVQGAQP
jgi:putative ABC transport system ATP-binding protein